MGTFANTLLRELKTQADELRLQLSLGKSEARDYIDQHGQDFSGVLADVAARVINSPLVGEEKTAAIKGKIDALRVQLALGEMETRDAYLTKKTQVETAMEDLKGEIGSLSEKTNEVTAKLASEVERRSDDYKAKLDTLGLNLGVTATIAEDELKATKEGLAQELKDLSSKIAPAVADAEKSLGWLAGEVIDNFESILTKVRDKI